jgi:hypothetical protein
MSNLCLIVVYTHTSFIIIGKKGRLPASGLGAKRPELHAPLQARLLVLHHYALFSHSLTRFLLSSPPSSRSTITKKVSPRLHLAMTLSPLSLPHLFCLTWKKTPLASSLIHQWHASAPSSTGSCNARPPPLGAYIVISFSALSSPSASSFCVFH